MQTVSVEKATRDGLALISSHTSSNLYITYVNTEKEVLRDEIRF